MGDNAHASFIWMHVIFCENIIAGDVRVKSQKEPGVDDVVFGDAILLGNLVESALQVEHAGLRAVGVECWEVWVIWILDALITVSHSQSGSHWRLQHDNWL